MSRIVQKEPLIIFGASGHAKSVIDTIHAESRYRVVGLIDSFQQLSCEFLGYKVLGGEEDIANIVETTGCGSFFVAVGDNYQRRAITQRLQKRLQTIRFVTIVHPSAVISPTSKLGAGVIVKPGAIISADVTVADGCVVNTRASIDHDCTLEMFSSVAPGATLGGNVTLGECSSVGLGANVSHRVSIGADSVIGTGAAVVDAIPKSVVAYGVPCRPVRPRKADETYL